MTRLARILKTSAPVAETFQQKPFWASSDAVWGDIVGERESVAGDFEGIVQRIYKGSGVVFACVAARLLVFSEARFAWRKFEEGRPADLFGTPDLKILERPWQNGTTGELLARMEQDVSFAGNAFITRVDDRHGDRLRRLRPDWVTIVTGSPNEDPFDIAARPVGYIYRSPRARSAVFLTTDQVAHYSPLPDPVAQWRGHSWISTILPEVRADQAATEHKKRFFENGATFTTVLSYDPTVSPDEFETYVELFKEKHEGVSNAYKTLHVGGGVDPKVISADFKQLDLRNLQGADETRIAAAAGVHPVILGLSEGLKGSALNAGNYGQVRRRFADMTMRPLWRSAAASLEALVPPPDDETHLWYDDDIPFLRDDSKEEAEIRDKQALTITRLVKDGFTAESAVKAVKTGDWDLLVHTGLFSVQLQAPGSQKGSQ